MILKVQLVRAIKVKAEQLVAIANFTPAEKSQFDSLTSSDPHRAQDVDRKIRDTFGPMAIGFKIYWPGTTEQCATATMEVTTFEVKEPNVPQAGLLTVDALSEKVILLTDGALVSELSRIGVFVDAKDINWRIVYQTAGN